MSCFGQCCHCCGFGFIDRIRILQFKLLRVRIQGFDVQKWRSKKTAEISFFLFLNQNCNLLILRPPKRTSKLQEKPSALKREHPALQKMKFINCFIFFWVFFSLLDQGPHLIRIRPGCGIRSRTLVSVMLEIFLFKKNPTRRSNNIYEPWFFSINTGLPNKIVFH